MSSKIPSSWILKIHNTLLHKQCFKKHQYGERAVPSCLILGFPHLVPEGFHHWAPINLPTLCCALRVHAGKHCSSCSQDIFSNKIHILFFLILILFYFLLFLKYFYFFNWRIIALHACMHAQSLQLHLTLSDPMDCSPTGSSVYGTLQASILEWVAMPYSGGFSRPGDQTHVYLHLLLCRQILYPLSYPGSPIIALQYCTVSAIDNVNLL